MNADGTKADDMLVLNIMFQPDQIGGFESVDSQAWKFANQSVFTASGTASGEVDGLGFDDLGDWFITSHTSVGG